MPDLIPQITFAESPFWSMGNYTLVSWRLDLNGTPLSPTSGGSSRVSAVELWTTQLSVERHAPQYSLPLRSYWKLRSHAYRFAFISSGMSIWRGHSRRVRSSNRIFTPLYTSIDEMVSHLRDSKACTTANDTIARVLQPLNSLVVIKPHSHYQRQ